MIIYPSFSIKADSAVPTIWNLAYSYCIMNLYSYNQIVFIALLMTTQYSIEQRNDSFFCQTLTIDRLFLSKYSWNVLVDKSMLTFVIIFSK